MLASPGVDCDGEPQLTRLDSGPDEEPEKEKGDPWGPPFKQRPKVNSGDRAYALGLSCSTSCTGSFFLTPRPLIWRTGSGGASFRTCCR